MMRQPYQTYRLQDLPPLDATEIDQQERGGLGPTPSSPNPVPDYDWFQEEDGSPFTWQQQYLLEGLDPTDPAHAGQLFRHPDLSGDLDACDDNCNDEPVGEGFFTITVEMDERIVPIPTSGDSTVFSLREAISTAITGSPLHANGIAMTCEEVVLHDIHASYADDIIVNLVGKYQIRL